MNPPVSVFLLFYNNPTAQTVRTRPAYLGIEGYLRQESKQATISIQPLSAVVRADKNTATNLAIWGGDFRQKAQKGFDEVE